MTETTIQHSLRRFSFLVLFSILFNSFLLQVNASHVAGGHASYTCLGGNKYKISFTFYVECGLPFWQFDFWNYYSPSNCGPELKSKYDPTKFPFGPNIPMTSMIEYSPVLLCTSLAPDNSCMGGKNPAFGIVKYDTIVTFPNQCKDWTFLHTGAAAVTTKITNLSGQAIVLSSTIDNTSGNCNNSVRFDDFTPVFYTCVNNTYSFNTGAYDPDGDSLLYYLVDAPNMVYNSPWTGKDPITGIKIDSLTGMFTFTPNTIGKFYIAVEVNEYNRQTKAWKSASIRQFEVIVQSCTNHPPDPTTGIIKNLAAPAIKTGSYSAELSEGDVLSFQATVNDSDAIDALSIDPITKSYLSGSTITVSGTNPATFTITWKVPTGTAGTTINFPVTVFDNHCPQRAHTTYMYTIKVKPKNNNITIASADVSICQGQSTPLSATGGTTFTWSVITGDAIIKGTNFSCNPCANPTASPSKTTTYKVTSDLSSKNIDTVIVTVKALPTATITGDTTICVGDSTTLTASGGTSFSWNTGKTTAAITVKPITNTTYTATVTNAGCSSTKSVTVIVGTPPTVSISGDTSLCYGDSTTLTASASASTFSWSTGETTAAIAIKPTITTPYTVTATNASGCSATKSATVTVFSPSAATITGDSVLCKGDSTTLTVSAGTTYLWSNNATTASITVNPSATTTYTATVTNASGCSTVVSKTVTVMQTLKAVITGDTLVCINDSSTLTASGGNSFLWSTGAKTASIRVKSTGSSSYSVKVTAGKCTDSTSVTVKTTAPPAVSVSGDTVTCSGENTTLTATSSTVGVQYLWNTKETTASITAKPTTSGTYTVIASVGSCADSAKINVNVNPSPVFTHTANTSITDGDTITLSVSATGTLNYLWSTKETTSSITVKPTNTSIYYITVTDANNCSLTDSIIVTVTVPECDVFVPNAFSPNDDGDNDKLLIYGACIAELSFILYDRWGEKVFETTNQNEGWDGNFRGNPVTPGVFVYYLKGTTLSGKAIDQKGNVSVIK